MKSSSASILSLLMLGVLPSCTTESDEFPSAPTAQVFAHDTDEPPAYSDWSTPVSLGPVVNSAFADFDPFIAKDGLSLFFTAGSNRGGGFGGFDLWVSQRASEDEPWGAPQNLGATINTSAREFKPSLSLDGHRLYFASNRSGGFGGVDLYVSRRRDKRDAFGWQPPVNLGSAINSTADEESRVAVFEDDATGTMIMYFASNRRDPTAGGAGDFDIYTATLLPDGTFSPALLVEELSTVFHRDRDPAIRRDGLEMFLASNRPGTYGALDLWVATRASTTDRWSAPENLGPVINTPSRPPEVEQANDWSPALSFDGTSLYFASAFRPGNISQMFDIWVTTRTKLRGEAEH